jgi:dihydrofolate reductase
MKTKIKMIACVNNKGVIGNDNKLLWHSKEDLNFFKRMTKGNAILMGRRTQESIKAYPLPDRLNLTLTSNPKRLYDVSSLDEAIFMSHGYKTLWIIGGQTLYEQFLESCEEVYLSSILDDQDGDKFFPYERMTDLFTNLEPLEVHENVMMSRWIKK